MSPDRQTLSDWHPADVKAALAKRGWTLTALAEAHGHCASYLRQTLIRKSAKGEAIIARVLRVKAGDIWPSRYRDILRRAA